MGARNQVGIGLSYRPASLCSFAIQFQTRFLESIPRLIAGLKFPTQYMCPLSLSNCITKKFSYRRKLFLRWINSMAESIPPEESMPRNRLSQVAINFLNYHFRSGGRKRNSDGGEESCPTCSHSTSPSTWMGRTSSSSTKKAASCLNSWPAAVPLSTALRFSSRSWMLALWPPLCEVCLTSAASLSQPQQLGTNSLGKANIISEHTFASFADWLFTQSIGALFRYSSLSCASIIFYRYRCQHPPTQWNLRGGRWSCVEYST